VAIAIVQISVPGGRRKTSSAMRAQAIHIDWMVTMTVLPVNLSGKF
jgi:hypothetical protein